jgi:hypothetical protein
MRWHRQAPQGCPRPSKPRPYAASAETGATMVLLVQEAIEYSPSDDLAASMIDLRIRDVESSQTSFTQASPAARRAGCS